MMFLYHVVILFFCGLFSGSKVFGLSISLLRRGDLSMSSRGSRKSPSESATRKYAYCAASQGMITSFPTSKDNKNKKPSKKSKSYDIPGYLRGDMELMKAVFEVNSLRSRMSFDAFLKSRYLRFWPGRKAEAETIWMEITGSSTTDGCITWEHLPQLLTRLDDVSIQTEREMEVERVTWEIEELNYNFLDNYFEKKAKGRKLSFTDFLAFENVQAEIWYHDGKGLTENLVAQIWETMAGCVSQSVDKATFLSIYNKVCSNDYKH